MPGAGGKMGSLPQHHPVSWTDKAGCEPAFPPRWRVRERIDAAIMWEDMMTTRLFLLSTAMVALGPPAARALGAWSVLRPCDVVSSAPALAGKGRGEAHPSVRLARTRPDTLAGEGAKRGSGRDQLA